MRVADETQKYVFHKERQEFEELGEKDVSELDFFPGGLEMEESVLDATEQEMVMCEENSKKDSCSNAIVKKKRRKKRLEITTGSLQSLVLFTKRGGGHYE